MEVSDRGNKGMITMEERFFKFRVNYRFPSLNEYIEAERKSKFGGSSEKRRLTKVTADAARKAVLDGFSIEPPFGVLIAWHEVNKRRDWDNVTWNKKAVLDGMVTAGMIPDDGQRVIPQPIIDIGTTGNDESTVEIAVWHEDAGIGYVRHLEDALEVASCIDGADAEPLFDTFYWARAQNGE